MKINVYHTISIEPTKGYEIEENPDITLEEGIMRISYFEVPLDVEADCETEASETDSENKDKLIDALQKQVDELSVVRVKEKEYKRRINELTALWQDLESENILLKTELNVEPIPPELLRVPKRNTADVRKIFNNQKTCACGCGTEFIPSGRNQKYATDCANLNKIQKDADLRRQNKHRGKTEVEAEPVSVTAEHVEPSCDDQETCKGIKCSLTDTIPYRHYKPKK